MDPNLREVLESETRRARDRRVALEAAGDADLVEQLFTLEQAFVDLSGALRAAYDDLTAILTIALRRWAPEAYEAAEERVTADA